MICLDTHVACNFNCLVDTEGRLKVTEAHVNCRCGVTSETVQD